MMKFKALILGIVLALSYSMGNEFAELFSDYAFYEGYPAGIHPDKNGNPLNAYNRLHGLVKFEKDKGSSQATVLEGNYIDGEKDGLFQLKSTVYEGVVLEEETYKNGKLDGESKRWDFIPKEADSPREYRILVSKKLYEAPKPEVEGQSETLKSISFDLEDINIVRQARHPCKAITLRINDSTQGNKHYYEAVLYSQTFTKEKNREYCISQYGFFETLLERFEKGEFNPFSNDSDYRVEKPFIGDKNKGYEEGFIYFKKGDEVHEEIIETINETTYKLVFGQAPLTHKYRISFTKNGVKIDPRVYNQEEFNTLLNKMYNKELSSFIAENLTELRINY